MMENGEPKSNIITTKNGKEIILTEATLEFKSGVQIYTWRMEPQNVKVRGLLFMAHGLAEHSRRLDDFASSLCSELDLLVVSHDHIGHGKSEGERVMIETMDTYVDDIFAHIDQVKISYPDLPVYLFGHSMGGTISILAALSKPWYFKALVLSAPAIVVDPDVAPGAIKVCVAKILNHLFPRMEIFPPIDPNVISSESEQLEAYCTDPLIWHGGVKLRFATAFGKAMDKIKEEIRSIEWPFLVVHGEDDRLVFIGGSTLLEKDAKSQDKEIKTYKGLRHEMLHEAKEHADRVASDIIEWLRKRI